MISIKTKEEIATMKEGGQILAKAIKELQQMVKPGVTTQELDRAAEALVLSFGGQCSFKGYDGFPACLCASVNEEVVHAAPSARALKEGDIISLDLGVFYKGFHADMAVTVPVGKIDSQTQKLIEATRNSLTVGIKAVKPGKTFGDVSRAIQNYVESQGFHAVKDLCGHGIGRNLHEEPQILNYTDERDEDKGIEIKEGMTFCLEPMVTTGNGEIKEQGIAYKTADGSLSAHFEHTIVATKNGAEILT
jgi:methionyl aminopeptidase